MTPDDVTSAWKSLGPLDRAFFVYAAAFGLGLWVTKGDTKTCAPTVALLLETWPWAFGGYACWQIVTAVVLY
ncbi:MAG: hypothetical protein HY719_06255 [Planctomycetes bacterium]|nr:hypothetical protein [Planctomycetota bacterium]